MCKNCETGGKPIGAVWWRVSTADQKELSPITQRHEAETMLIKSGYVIPDAYVLGAEWSSPEVMDCPEFKQLIRLVEQRAIHAIGIYHPDRLTARPADRLFLRALCEKNEVEFITKFGEIMGGPEGEFLDFAQTWAKYLQVVRAQESSRDGLRDRAKIKGLMPSGTLPFGYEYAKSINSEGETVKDQARVLASKDWHIAKRIFDDFFIKGMAIRKVGLALEADGIPSPKGRERWDPSTISGMLRNPLYGGKAFGLRHKAVIPKRRVGRTYGKSSIASNPREDWIELSVEVADPVVNWMDFQAIQERLEHNKKYSPRNSKFQYLLRGLIVCELHDRPFHGVHHRGEESGFVYQCGSYAHGKPHEVCKRSIWGPNIEREAWSRAVNILNNPELIMSELERRDSAKSDSEEFMQDSLKRAEKKLESNKRAEVNLVNMRARDEIDEEIYQRNRAMFRAERTWCEEEIERLNDRLRLVRQKYLDIEQLKHLCQQIGGKLEDSTFKDKRFILEALETRVYVSIDGRKRIAFAIPEREQTVLTGPGKYQPRLEQ